MIREIKNDIRLLFFRVGNSYFLIKYLETYDKWMQRLQYIENSINHIHPSLLYLSLLICKRSMLYFNEKR